MELFATNVCMCKFYQIRRIKETFQFLNTVEQIKHFYYIFICYGFGRLVKYNFGLYPNELHFPSVGVWVYQDINSLPYDP